MADKTNPDIRVLVGVKGTGLSSGSGAQIQKDLNKIAEQISNGEFPKITIKLDEKRTTSVLQSQLNRISRELSVTIGATKDATDTKGGRGAKYSGEYKQYIAALREEYNLRTKIATANPGGTYAAELKEQLSTQTGIVAQLRAQVISTNELNAAQTVQTSLDNKLALAQAKHADAAGMLGKQIAAARSNLQLFEYKYGSFKGNPQLAEEFKELVRLSQTLGSSADLNNFNQKLKQFSVNVQAAGRASKSLGTQLRELVGRFTYLVSGMMMFSMLRRFTSSAIDNVKAIDSSMVELKKVTEGTDSTYEIFLDNAAEKAKDLHASLTDVIDATSNFARLGYNIPQASMLADAAIIYANVGDEVKSVDDAAGSIISTMQAFGVKTSNVTSIVDKFNEVGNNFAISSGGIGEALRRSAAPLAAANNTLDQSIALITAANTIVQNPEVVGELCSR